LFWLLPTETFLNSAFECGPLSKRAWFGQVKTFDMTARIADNHDVTLVVDRHESSNSLARLDGEIRFD